MLWLISDGERRRETSQVTVAGRKHTEDHAIGATTRSKMAEDVGNF